MIKIPSSETIQQSAIRHLRDLKLNEDAELLGRSKIEISEETHQYSHYKNIGLIITLRCRANDRAKFIDKDDGQPNSTYYSIEQAIESVLPAQFDLYTLSMRSLVLDGSSDFNKQELKHLIESQIDLMIAVSTGGPSIKEKNDEYKERQESIREKLKVLGKKNPNSFEDLWDWYGRWKSGDLPTYQSRREYVRKVYDSLLKELAGTTILGSSEPSREPTGWEKVDRIVDGIINKLEQAKSEEDFQTVGLLCREALISLAQAVYDPIKHKSSDGVQPSKTDADRMLEAYFAAEFSGAKNEALRRHAKASLSLANELQHKQTAKYKDAALCSEATRTVVNIVAITSERR